MPELLAYLDPGSGSMLLQALVGGVAAAGVTAKLFWRRLKSRVAGGAKNDAPPEGG